VRECVLVCVCVCVRACALSSPLSSPTPPPAFPFAAVLLVALLSSLLLEGGRPKEGGGEAEKASHHSSRVRNNINANHAPSCRSNENI